jgi:hypothetical protein
MSGKDTSKLAMAALLLVVAGGLFFYQSRSAEGGPEGEDVSHWYCTKSRQYFSLRGEESDSKVKSMRKAPAAGAGGEPAARTPASASVVMALSPYSNEWTGVAAMKCPHCGEVFVMETEGSEESICPKCEWNPRTGGKGRGSPAPGAGG